MGKVPRIYADTSVFGGACDAEFASASRQMWKLVRMGALRLVISELVEEEVSLAPQSVRELFEEVTEDAEVVEITSEAVALWQAYIDAGVVVPALVDGRHARGSRHRGRVRCHCELEPEAYRTHPADSDV